MPQGIRDSLVGALIMAGVSTLGDFIWVVWIPRHLPVYGMTHGTLLFAVLGLVLGAFAGRRLAGTLAGAGVGFAAAGSFYLLAPSVGFSVMFVVWFGIWIALAFLDSWLNGLNGANRGRPPGSLAVRGVSAAVLSGIAFYLVSGIWMPFNPVGPDYLVHFGAWTFAFLPGFCSIFLKPAAVEKAK
jgi:hypothetical protein